MTNLDKGGLMSESFTLWLQSPRKGAKSENYPRPQRALCDGLLCDLAPFFGDCSQSEKTF